MPKIKVLRGNTSSLANYAGQSGEIALNSDTGNIYFWTNTANVFYTFAGVVAGGGAAAPQQAENYAYSVSGRTYTSGSGSPALSTYDKYSLTSDSNAASSPAPKSVVQAISGSSTTHGYHIGGYNPNTTPGSFQRTTNKLAFSGDTWSTNIGNISNDAYAATGVNDRVGGHSYHYGGTPNVTVYEKIPHASDTNFSPVGTTGTGASYGAGASSPTTGYVMGGSGVPGTPNQNQVISFPFSSDVDGTNIGALLHPAAQNTQASGQNSDVSAYITGFGQSNTSYNNLIYKFPFASATVATNVGNLVLGRYFGAGASSTTHGYYDGGRRQPPTQTYNNIDKFPFSSDTNASDVGNLTAARNEHSNFNY